MIQTIRRIFNAEILLVHFLLKFLLLFLLSSSLYILIITLFYWVSFGDGETATRIANLALNACTLNCAALIVVVIITLSGSKGKVNSELSK